MSLLLLVSWFGCVDGNARCEQVSCRHVVRVGAGEVERCFGGVEDLPPELDACADAVAADEDCELVLFEFLDADPASCDPPDIRTLPGAESAAVDFDLFMVSACGFDAYSVSTSACVAEG